MTNEELIDFIKSSKGHWTFKTESGKEVSEEQIIKALEQQPLHGYKIDMFTPTAQAWLSTFNTDSATECFAAVQELKKRLEGENND